MNEEKHKAVMDALADLIRSELNGGFNEWGGRFSDSLFS
jgi:hypothetical protein